MNDVLVQGLMTTHPVTAAAALGELEAQALAELMGSVPPQTASDVLQHMAPHKVTGCLEELPTAKAVALLASLPTAVAAPLLERMDEQMRQQLMHALPLAAYTSLRLVQRFPAGSVGSVMDARALTLPEDMRVEDALRRIRQVPQTVLHLLFVLDAAHRLKGRIAVHDLVTARRKAKLGSLMQTEFTAFQAATRLSEIEQHPVWTSDTLAAVVDRKGTFLGVLDQERMVSALQSIADEGQAPGLAATLLALADLLWSALGVLLLPDPARAPVPREVRRDE